MSHLLDSSAKGVYTISATPFTDSGDIDWPSVDSLVEFYLQWAGSGSGSGAGSRWTQAPVASWSRH